MVPVGAVKRNVKARCQVRVPVVLVARGAEPGSAKCAFGHYLLPPRRLAISFGNAGYPDKIPTGADLQPRFRRVSARHISATSASPVFSPVKPPQQLTGVSDGSLCRVRARGCDS